MADKESISPYLRSYPLKFDDLEEMDISYGEEFLKTHNVTTHKSTATITTDVRLQKLYHTIMKESISEGASDIQIADWGDYGLVRLRIGSKMQPYRVIDKNAVESLTLVFRDKAEINPEKIRSSDIEGTIAYKFKHNDGSEQVFDTRLAFSPTIRGSMVSIRILYPTRLDKTIDELGLSDKVSHAYKQAIKSDEGLIILTGSTGSGKALNIETPIPLYNKGFKRMGDLEVEDIILDSSFKPTKVLEIFEHEDNPCFKITFSDGTEVIADEEHLWGVYDSNNDYSVKTTFDIFNHLEVVSLNKSDYAVKLTDVPNDLKNVETTRFIVGCEPVPSVKTRCITVDSPSHLFLCTESYIPTHNTTTQMTGIKQILVNSEFTSNIMTIENPVEYRLEGVVQSSVNTIHGYTFPVALQTILRQDPDVILVGEINDKVTAQTAIRAATSGHLVFTTVHANNVLEVSNALRQLEVSDIDMGNALRIIIYQTLKDKLCPYCREQSFVNMEQKKWMDSKLLGQPEQATYYKAHEGGCEHCKHKGVLGRVMLTEMVEANFVYRIIKDKHGTNIDAMKHELLNTEGASFYPLEYDVYRHLQEGNISFEDAVSMVGK